MKRRLEHGASVGAQCPRRGTRLVWTRQKWDTFDVWDTPEVGHNRRDMFFKRVRMRSWPTYNLVDQKRRLRQPPILGRVVFRFVVFLLGRLARPCLTLLDLTT